VEDVGEQFCRNFHERMRKAGERREIVFRHPDEFVVLTIARNLHPVVFE
jgi:hypothetical protein